MNIFYLDEDPLVAARYHCDKHVVKMITETAQMLCTAHREILGTPVIARAWCIVGNQRVLKEYVHSELPGDEYDKDRILIKRDYYLSTHKNHPSSCWVREARDNYSWAFKLFQGLMSEFHERYGSTHASARLIPFIGDHPLGDSAPVGFSPPPQAMPDQYKSTDTVGAYRQYYRGEKARFAVWRNQTPYWWKETSMNTTPALQIIAKHNTTKAKVARPAELAEKEPPVYFAPGIFDDVTGAAFPALEKAEMIAKNEKGKYYLTDKGIAEAEAVFDKLPADQLKLAELQAKYDSFEKTRGYKFRKKADAIAAIEALTAGTEEPEIVVAAPKGGGGGRTIKDGIIRLIVKENPKKPDTKAHHKYGLYKDGMKISEFLAAGGERADLSWDSNREYIKLEDLPAE